MGSRRSCKPRPAQPGSGRADWNHKADFQELSAHSLRQDWRLVAARARELGSRALWCDSAKNCRIARKSRNPSLSERRSGINPMLRDRQNGFNRRNFLGRAFSVLAAFGVGISASGQRAAMQSGHAVVCDPNVQTVKCPLGHETCREIDATPVVGNNSHDYPSTAQLYDYRMLRCGQCGVLFADRY